MTWLSLLLVVIAALIHAAWNLLAKRAAMVGAAFVFAYSLCAMVLYLPWALWALLHEEMTWSWPVLACIALSAVVRLAYNLALQRGYQVADLSVVYPVARGTAPLLASLAAIALLGEGASLRSVSGMLCVVVGVLLIATQGNLSLLRQPQAWVGVRWGLWIGIFIALYTVVDAYAVKELLILPVLFDWITNAARTAIMVPHIVQRRKAAWAAMRDYWPLAWIIGLLYPMAYILVLYALQHGAPVSLVAPAREMSMMVGTLAGYFWLKETVTAGRWVGCVVILFGVVLLGGS